MGRWHIVTGPFAFNAPHTDMKISWRPTIAAALAYIMASGIYGAYALSLYIRRKRLKVRT